ncbi:MAG: arsenate reductase [Hyphomonadaceae bacterium]|nr:arsenate reductase [Hyphomonadaceae bacterium]
MTDILLHHTGCGTSRKGLALLQEKGIEPELRKYMNASERLGEDELREIAKKLGTGPRSFLREKDAVKFELSPEAGDDEVFAAMAAEPRLIQRPILIAGDRAALGRPIESMLEIL